MRRLVRTAVLPAALAVIAVAVSLTGCSAGGDDGRRSIVVTTNILGDITRSVVGAEAEVTVLMPANADPHSFGISAPQAAAIERADLIVHNGLGLEENVLRHVDAAAEAGVPVFAAGAAVDPIDYGTDETAGSPDPHFWTDPERVHRAVGLIANQITKHVDGVDATAVRAGADRYRKEIAELTQWMRKSFGEIPVARRNLVTNHHVFGYLAQRFGFRVIGAVIPSGTTLASPSASDLKSLVTAVDRAGVRAVFADSSQPDRLAQVLKRESERDIRVIPLFSESLTEKGGGAGTYLDMMRANTRSIVAGLAP
ncbi:zinc ABC transporter substrate-binding protein AztC [Streptomyces sp. CAU 1734]|uniref:zinc ABC transporter substrate-binding protein AztC n=1 Tax=Streptomyces sp. CAU 1734 TaxID=3140360 RepID=UPI0032613B93